MALDGTVIAAIARELDLLLKDGRITKITQPERDEILLTVKTGSAQRLLFMSANASLPLIYLTDSSKPSPATAPTFCMVLRKHIGNGRIKSVTQPGLERAVRIEIEHLDELGDYNVKYLIIEIMAKHSNIIFTDRDNTIIDSIKRIPPQVSSVREVLPGRPYFIPKTDEKLDPLHIGSDDVRRRLSEASMPSSGALVSCFKGISPFTAEEICFEAGIDSDKPANCLEPSELTCLSEMLITFADRIKAGDFCPNMIKENGKPSGFSVFESTIYPNATVTYFDSPSKLLQTFYSERNTVNNIRQKSADLKRLTDTALERTRKKLDLQLKQEKDAEKRSGYRLYGELLQTYGYGHNGGESEMTVLNYYDNTELKIPLDKDLSALENAKRYFDRYQKLKRTHEALESQLVQTRADIEHLESISDAISHSVTEDDFAQIRIELADYGYIKKHEKASRKKKSAAKPLHFVSADGFHIYVGKNNYQNEDLTFGLADGSDWWFHAKNAPGSHVILKSGNQEPADETFEAAAALAAFYSSLKASPKAEVDYTKKKNIKKPAGGRPGFVTYHNNYSMSVSPEIRDSLRLEK